MSKKEIVEKAKEKYKGLKGKDIIIAGQLGKTERTLYK